MDKAKEGSKAGDIISWIVMFAAIGFLAYRVKTCRDQEHAAEQKSVAARQEAEKKDKDRVEKCLAAVPADKRSDCVKCSCEKCAQALEACNDDPKCRTLPLGEVVDAGADAGSQAEATARAKLRAKADCVLHECAQLCLGK